MRVILTGAGGFLGWHTRLRLHALTEHEVVSIDRTNWSTLPAAAANADAIIHIAGANRGSDEQIMTTNAQLAQDLAHAVRSADTPVRLVLAGTISAGMDTAYGRSKQEVVDTLAAAADDRGSEFVNVALPNLFGEHARPHYNSFTATFIDHTITGTEPMIADREAGLLHAQDAANFLVEALTASPTPARDAVTPVSIQQVWDLLQEFKASYDHAEIPDLSDKFRIDLFNAYRAALFPQHYPLNLTPHDDPRGRFVETVRVRGGQGQSSISTTVPGITRGEHYHLHKIERFAVLQGEATICLRRMFSDDVITFRVSGREPAAIDMPTGWAHNITNVGSDTLLTQFWAHELFRPDAPDTFAERVRCEHTQEI